MTPSRGAVARGRDGVEVRETPLAFSVEDGYVHERVDRRGTPVRLVSAVHAAAR